MGPVDRPVVLGVSEKGQVVNGEEHRSVEKARVGERGRVEQVEVVLLRMTPGMPHGTVRQSAQGPLPVRRLDVDIRGVEMQGVPVALLRPIRQDPQKAGRVTGNAVARPEDLGDIEADAHRAALAAGHPVIARRPGGARLLVGPRLRPNLQRQPPQPFRGALGQPTAAVEPVDQGQHPSRIQLEEERLFEFRRSIRHFADSRLQRTAQRRNPRHFKPQGVDPLPNPQEDEGRGGDCSGAEQHNKNE